MFKWVEKILPQRANYAPPPPIVLTPEGFSSPDSDGRGEAVNVRWDEVLEIVTWKDDLWSYDEIRLGIQYGERCFLGLSEEQAGFSAFVEEMRRRFPEIPNDWYFKVMIPAFVANYTMLYRRQQQRG